MHSELLAMSSSSTAFIYAELLSNIGQVTVIAWVAKPIAKDTRVELSDDKNFLKLYHDGQTLSLALPARIEAESISQKPAFNGNEVSWRLPLASQGPVNRGADFADSTVAPWSANKLSVETRVNCRKCGSTMVHPRQVTTWKDLPSENWAEMMDFWHCHKPHDHQHGGQSSVENKGYGANTKLGAQSGVGFVGLTYFLFSEEDCIGIKIPPGETDVSQTTSALICATCSTPLGVFDSLSSGYRLYKWNLTLLGDTIGPTTYPLSMFMAAHFLSQISSQAVNRFLVYCPSDITAPVLHIWVLHQRITIALHTRPTPFPATKFYYTTPSTDSIPSLLASSSKVVSAIEETRLPAGVVRELVATVEASTRMLPPSARRWREWQIGFLERWTED